MRTQKRYTGEEVEIYQLHMEPNIMTEPETKYILLETVDYTEEKFGKILIGGVGSATKYEVKSMGWFLRLQGSNESFFLSETEPDLKAGDRVKITLEKTEV